MKGHDRHILSMVVLGMGSFVLYPMMRYLLDAYLSHGICCIGSVPTYKIRVPDPKLKMSKSKATDTDNVLFNAKKEELDTLGLAEAARAKKNHN